MVVFAHGFILFLLGRAIQGFGAARPRIVIVAILRDKFKGAQMAKVLSLVMGIFILASIFAPSVGYLILQVAPWRIIFWAGWGLVPLVFFAFLYRAYFW